MRKQEFLNELRNKLAGLPEDDVNDRIAFYSEMIDDRIDEGKTEEEAVADFGGVDSVVNDIAQDTSLMVLVKERVKPKGGIKGWQIALICVGFPIWLPLLIVAIVLALVAYLLIWILVIVTYAVETGLLASSVAGLIVFFGYLTGGEFNLIPLGISVMCAGGAALLFFGCVGATKVTLKLSKKIFTSIKAAFIKKGNK